MVRPPHAGVGSLERNTKMKLIKLASVLAAAAFVTVGCAKQEAPAAAANSAQAAHAEHAEHGDHVDHVDHANSPEAQAKKQDEEIPGPVDGKVVMKVTKRGYEPSPVKLKAGEEVTLEITRVEGGTCATEIVIPGYDIETPLPVGETVTVTFTPRETGKLKYGCAMRQMISGVFYVE